MKKLLLFTLTGISIAQLNAQQLPGISTSNYNGVNGVFSNPANIAGSPYRFDVNLFSLNILAANDQASFSLSNISDNFKTDGDDNQMFGKDAGPASGMFQLDLRGPSAMFNVGKKNSFALSTRARVFANIQDIDGKLFDKLSEDFSDDPSLPYTLSANHDMRMAINAWTEFGASYARVLAQKGPHYFKGGITLKYLAGAGNGYINIDHFNGTIDQNTVQQDVFLRNTTGRIATGFGGVQLSGAETGDIFNMNSRGFGTDIGFVYEFRPGGSLLNGKSYKLKLGAALLDVGSIKYEKDMQRSGAYNMDITGSEKLSLKELGNIDIDDYNSFFADRPTLFTPDASNTASSYKVSLPTSLQLEADYHVISGLYANVTTQFALSKSKKKGYNSYVNSGFTVTPRFEMKRFGFYLPINYNDLTKVNAGAALRVGPMYVGSGSIVSALMGKSKQADIYFGFRIGILK
jgi:hypothetical protein